MPVTLNPEFTTIQNFALNTRQNLEFVRRRAESQRAAYNGVAYGTQLVTAFLGFLMFPVEEYLDILDGWDGLTPALERLLDSQEFNEEFKHGYRANLPRIRLALALGRVDVVVYERDVTSLRFTLPDEEYGDGFISWEWDLPQRRMGDIVRGLCELLPYLAVTPTSSPGGPRRKPAGPPAPPEEPDPKDEP